MDLLKIMTVPNIYFLGTEQLSISTLYYIILSPTPRPMHDFPQLKHHYRTKVGFILPLFGQKNRAQQQNIMNIVVKSFKSRIKQYIVQPRLGSGLKECKVRMRLIEMLGCENFYGKISILICCQNWSVKHV